ncbi:N-acetylneuraminate synthase [uncultured Tyzzerella sp.]|uniref:N-acetylneuraminate synthase n=1 Tax=uncultured Tyzzerella sp. TaxID=2321398 RepID=UPI0029428AED|nr:N-acetylneuraminate synthase [uncultured Tyzzerella sp.]
MSVFIIAEIGVNHNGDLELAKKMILEAKKAGVDAVKFQSFKADKLVSKDAKKADYQIKNTEKQESQHDMIKRLELTEEDHIYLKEICDNEGIMFLSSPFDIESASLLLSLGIDTVKIPSGEITNLPYLEEIGKLYKNIIISTGMSNLDEIKDAISVLNKYGDKNITVLHCNTEYPTPMEDVNLLAIKTLEKELNLPIGYSDHTDGIEVSISAVALGATVIEKHFTLDKNLDGPDHKASLEPRELKQMVTSIRNIEKALGNGIKVPSKSEKKNIVIARKSIVAKSNICKGEVFTNENLAIKRPGDGISPMKWYEVLGQVAKRDFVADERIEL